MSAETVPGHEITYHLIAYDKDGQERPEHDGLYSHVLLGKAANTNPSDIFLFSHGWNGDIPAAPPAIRKLAGGNGRLRG